jgi:hypothetical protein
MVVSTAMRMPAKIFPRLGMFLVVNSCFNNCLPIAFGFLSYSHPNV